jgi:hypothetical protein
MYDNLRLHRFQFLLYTINPGNHLPAHDADTGAQRENNRMASGRYQIA